MARGNDACADCKARNPRWASHNLGIFICVNCASIHRKIGTHVTKIKSLTMDTWTKEQVEFMKQNGNVKCNAYYNPNEARNPPPANMSEFERDSELEKFIRSKYEYRRFVDKPAVVASKLGPSRTAASVSRPMSTPLTNASGSQMLGGSSSNRPSSSIAQPATSRTVSQPVAPPVAQAPPAVSSVNPPARGSSRYATALVPSTTMDPAPSPLQAGPSASVSNPTGVWADLVSIQQGSSQGQLPLQYQTPQQVSPQAPALSMQFQTMPQNTGYLGTSSPMQTLSPGLYPQYTGLSSQNWQATSVGPQYMGGNPSFGGAPQMSSPGGSIPTFQPQSSFGQQMLSPPTQHQQTPPQLYTPPQLFQPQPSMTQNSYQAPQQFQSTPSPLASMHMGGGSPAFLQQGAPLPQSSPMMFQQQQPTGMPPQGYFGQQQPMQYQQQPMQQNNNQYTGWMQTGPGGQTFQGGM